MEYLLDQLRYTLEKECRPGRGWANAKPVIASVIAKHLAENYNSIRKIYLIDLSGGESNDTLEGGFDIDLYIEAEDPKEAIELKRLEEKLDKIVQEAIKKLRPRDCVDQRNHNLVELHVNSEFVKPLIKSKYSYKVRLYETN